MTQANIKKWTQVIVSILGLLASSGLILAHAHIDPSTNANVPGAGHLLREVTNGQWIEIAAALATSLASVLKASEALFPQEDR